jgi:hypothetical protein
VQVEVERRHPRAIITRSVALALTWVWSVVIGWSPDELVELGTSESRGMRPV